MKLVCLNVWGGQMGKLLTDFIQTHKDADVFCFQEVFSNGISGSYKDLLFIKEARPNLFQEFEELLPEHKGIMCTVHDSIYGIAIFIKKDIKIVSTGEWYLYKNDAMDWSHPTMDHTRKMQWVKMEVAGKQMVVINLHGFHSPTKTDSPERLAQAKIISEFLKSLDAPFILVGDFNMTLETESTRIIEKEARNLVREYGITTTRNELYKKKTDAYADFIFVSKNIDVTDFLVLPDLVSDHCPLVLEWKN